MGSLPIAIQTQESPLGLARGRLFNSLERLAPNQLLPEKSPSWMPLFLPSPIVSLAQSSPARFSAQKLNHKLLVYMLVLRKKGRYVAESFWEKQTRLPPIVPQVSLVFGAPILLQITPQDNAALTAVLG